MAEWHLREIRRALERRGWVITERPGDEYRIAGTWELRRAGDDRVIQVDFDGLDDMRTLPLTESYGCRVRDGQSNLYLRRARSHDLWEGELAAFVSSLDV